MPSSLGGPPAPFNTSYLTSPQCKCWDNVMRWNINFSCPVICHGAESPRQMIRNCPDAGCQKPAQCRCPVSACVTTLQILTLNWRRGGGWGSALGLNNFKVLWSTKTSYVLRWMIFLGMVVSDVQRVLCWWSLFSRAPGPPPSSVPVSLRSGDPQTINNTGKHPSPHLPGF